MNQGHDPMNGVTSKTDQQPRWPFFSLQSLLASIAVLGAIGCWIPKRSPWFPRMAAMIAVVTGLRRYNVDDAGLSIGSDSSF
jgi:hypothetical protein